MHGSSLFWQVRRSSISYSPSETTFKENDQLKSRRWDGIGICPGTPWEGKRVYAKICIPFWRLIPGIPPQTLLKNGNQKLSTERKSRSPQSLYHPSKNNQPADSNESTDWLPVIGRFGNVFLCEPVFIKVLVKSVLVLLSLWRTAERDGRLWGRIEHISISIFPDFSRFLGALTANCPIR